jgi:hypothetical protein
MKKVSREFLKSGNSQFNHNRDWEAWYDKRLAIEIPALFSCGFAFG